MGADLFFDAVVTLCVIVCLLRGRTHADRLSRLERDAYNLRESISYIRYNPCGVVEFRRAPK